jgi:glycosyltransferase involved in cell wall biosynthesis
MPTPYENNVTDEKREPYFITLGGSIHKNLKRVTEAFNKVKEDHPEYELLILGDVDRKEELPEKIPEYIRFEDMSQYTHHLQHASGLIFCSLHEGLGIPAIEAMQHHCPLLLSDIPSLREICNNYAYFVNSFEINDITNGINELIKNQDYWITKSKEGKEHYKSLSEDSGKKLLELYQRNI